MALIIYMGRINIMAGRRWTEDEVDYILLAHSDNESTVEEVADFLGRTVSSVRCKSEIINKGKGQFTKRHWQDEEIRILRRYYQKVQDLSQLAKILNRSLDAVIIKANKTRTTSQKKEMGCFKIRYRNTWKNGYEL